MPKTIITPVLVGRSREIVTLEQALRLAQNGAGRCILLAGEAGIGKSRLAAELAERGTAAHFTILQGYCSEQDSSFPYAPWIDALRAFLAPKSTAETNELLDAFAPELVQLLPELSLLMPSIQAIPRLDPAAEKHHLFESLARLIAGLAASHPVLIILEDLHSSDEQSLELLHFLVRRISAAPILILGTYRGEESSPPLAYHLAELDRERLVEEVQLAPLDRSEVGQMAQAILKTGGSVGPEWLDLLMPLTEGNPFFVEEMVKSLVKTGARAGQWDSLQIPHSIQLTVQRRVAELPEGTRLVLSMASVIGERFDFALLQEVSAEDESSLLKILKELIAAQLIVEQTADQFSFRHALTRQAVYTALMIRERKAMHRTIGETIEGFAGTQAEAPVAPLAYHFYQAGDWQKAMEYSQRAGEKAQGLYAPREALTHFSHALEAAQKLGIPMPLPSLRGRAQVRELLGDFEGARADFETALEFVQQHADRLNEWQALIDLGSLWQSRHLERAGEYYQHALELARDLEDKSAVAWTLNRVGNWYFNRGRGREALPFHQEALELFQKLDDRHGMAQTMDLLGLVNYQIGDAIQGAAYLEQAVPILRELDDRQGLVNTLTNLTARAHFDTQVLGEINYKQLVDLGEEAAQIAAGFYWHQGEALALVGVAMNLVQVGDYACAIMQLSRAQPLAEESQHHESLANNHLVLGEILIQLLAMTEARPHLETALALGQELGSGILIPAATARLAEVSIFQGDLRRAKELLDAALPAGYPEGEVLHPLRGCWAGRAELELALSHPGRALEIVDRLLTDTPNLARYGPYAVPRLSLLRAQALAALRRTDEAETELRGALSVASRQGQLPVLWRLHADLGRNYRTLGRRHDADREFHSARTILQDLANHVPEGALRENFLQQALGTIPATHALTWRQTAKRESGGLTAREREVAALIAHGKSNREIADELVISEKTTERHVANILLKLDFNSRTQIAAWVVAKGMDK